MAKGNRNLAAKVARNGAMYFNGTLDRDYYRSQYQQGHEAWTNGIQLSNLWHPHKVQGWKKARDHDLKFLEQLKQRYAEKGTVPKPHIIDAVVNRLKLVA